MNPGFTGGSAYGLSVKGLGFSVKLTAAKYVGPVEEELCWPYDVLDKEHPDCGLGTRQVATMKVYFKVTFTLGLFTLERSLGTRSRLAMCDCKPGSE